MGLDLHSLLTIHYPYSFLPANCSKVPKGREKYYSIVKVIMLHLLMSQFPTIGQFEIVLDFHPRFTISHGAPLTKDGPEMA